MTAPTLAWALCGLVRAGGDVDRELARRLGLRPLDYTGMSHIMTSPAPRGPARLSKRLGISTGSAAELVDCLERAGHLIRRPYPQDRCRVVQSGDDSATGIIGGLRPLRERTDALAAGFTGGGAVVDRVLSALGRKPLPQLRALGGAPSQSTRDDPVEHSRDGSTS